MNREKHTRTLQHCISHLKMMLQNCKTHIAGKAVE